MQQNLGCIKGFTNRYQTFNSTYIQSAFFSFQINLGFFVVASCFSCSCYFGSCYYFCLCLVPMPNRLTSPAIPRSPSTCKANPQLLLWKQKQMNLWSSSSLYGKGPRIPKEGCIVVLLCRGSCAPTLGARPPTLGARPTIMNREPISSV